MVKQVGFVLIAIALVACQNAITNQDLKAIKKPIPHQLHFLIAGLPSQETGRNEPAFLQEETKNWQVSMVAGVSTGNGGLAGTMPLLPDRIDYLNHSFYGTIEQLFDPISYIFEEHGIEKKQIQLKTDFIKPMDETILLILDIKTSQIIDSPPLATIGVGIGAGKNKSVGGIGASYGDRSWCHAEMTASLTFVTKDRRSKRYHLEAKGRDVKKERENVAKIAYQSASEQLAKEILYQLFILSE